MGTLTRPNFVILFILFRLHYDTLKVLIYCFSYIEEGSTGEILEP